MSGNIGNLGAANLLRKKNHAVEIRHVRAEGWMRRAKGLLMILALGVMLAGGTAYASEPASPAPVATAANQVDHTVSTYNGRRPRQILDSSPALGDSFFDWSIGIFLVIMAALFSIGFMDSKEKGGE